MFFVACHPKRELSGEIVLRIL